MRTLITFLLIACIHVLPIMAQSTFKHIQDQPFIEPQPIHISHFPQAYPQAGRTIQNAVYNSISSSRPSVREIESFQITASGSFWITFHPNQLWENRQATSALMDHVLRTKSSSLPIDPEWKEVNSSTEDNGTQHLRIEQQLGGHPIRGQEMILHIRRGVLESMNGYAWTGRLPEKLPAPVPVSEIKEPVHTILREMGVSFQTSPTHPALIQQTDTYDLVWVPQQGQLRLAYKADIHPNAMDHWTVYIDAVTMELMEAISQKCSFAPLHLFHFPEEVKCAHDHASGEAGEETAATLLMDGATTVTDQDLLGQNRTVHGYQVGTDFFLIDASRPGMFQAAQSVMPNEPVGTIWTIDARNSSPSQSNFEVFHVSNSNNNWANLEVSAHFNAGQAYEYFRQTFNRNSINGNGGNIVSIINVTDENDNDMDNAFWNGTAMFYGNGDFAFKELARGLDVAGHEMSHGVIQNTANLEYVGQSGALNESFADVFGAMIDREDFRMGEDVVNLSAFPSGALRDMQNPHNGGNSFGDPGWQPAHMNEFQNLPNTPQGDNGGVHVNSGIPNRAFFLIANAIGREKAERIYYKALTDYLVKSSQFIDMRNAADKAATDLHGNGSAEVNAVRSAFDAVGIGAGQGGDYEEDIDINNGDDFILSTDGNNSDLYFIPPTNPNQFVKMEVPAPISRPSFTDDGSACVYVDDEQNLIVINFDWTSGLQYQAFYIESNPQGIWRNIVVSKDGSRIAFVTANLRNEIIVFDFVSGQEEVFELFNPTSASGGINTGDVLYADAMEWDYSGDYVMYDALNRIESGFGDGIEYWDISFLHAWNTSSDALGTGQIGKLFPALPENISIGNASFSKNSPYIITFDYAETYFDIFGGTITDYYILAANIEAGSVNEVYQNTTIGYPSYSRLDDKILFTYDNFGQILLGTINMQSGDKTLPVSGTDVILIEGAQKGVWFTVGMRDFSSTDYTTDISASLAIQPQPVADRVYMTWNSETPSGAYVISDMTGRRLMNGNVTPGGIDVQQLPSGMYVLEFHNETQSARKMLVKP